MCPVTAEKEDPEVLLREMIVLGEATRTSEQALEPFAFIDIKGGSIAETTLDDHKERI